MSDPIRGGDIRNLSKIPKDICNLLGIFERLLVPPLGFSTAVGDEEQRAQALC